MIPTEPPTTRSKMPCDVLVARDHLATLTCPNCLGTLRIKADTRAEAPCPICQHPLVYEPPAPADPDSFVPKQRPVPDSASAPQAAPKKSLRTYLREADDFINTPGGTALAWAFLAFLVTACVALFFAWDQDRRLRTNQMEAIESQRPPASQRVSTSSVPLLPGESALVESPE